MAEARVQTLAVSTAVGAVVVAAVVRAAPVVPAAMAELHRPERREALDR